MSKRSRSRGRPEPPAPSAGTPEAAPAPGKPVAVAKAKDIGEAAFDSAWLLAFGAWVVATVATLGALFLSEVMQVAPCVLCWYQRIFMFPLVLLLPLGLFPFDAKIVRYAVPMAAGGMLTSLFHVLLVAGVIPESMKPCTQGVPCTEVQVQWLGAATLPVLSFIAFSAIAGLMIAARTRIPK
jgi:disulfide bond formation protein DsbB